MAGTCRRATTSHSFTEQESRPAIQILQNRTISNLKPVNPEENDAILDANIETRTTTMTILTVLSEPPPRAEDVPSSPLSLMILSLWETKKNPNEPGKLPPATE